MLKNKKAVYLLIPLNILIWGFFIYRFYTAYNEGGDLLTTEKLPDYKIADLKDSLTYHLNTTYNDPFLKDVVHRKISVSGNETSGDVAKSKPAITTTQKPVEPPKPLPEVKYLGLIKNTSSGLATALVSINGQSRLVKLNEVVDGIVIKSFNRDSLVAKWGKEKIVAAK